jgi:preprotein translocase subunit SecE
MVKVKEFIGQVIKETSKITWSTRKETSVSVMLVLVMVLLASLFFLLVDMSAYKAVQMLLNLGVN